jgi:hypothetical protein
MLVSSLSLVKTEMMSFIFSPLSFKAHSRCSTILVTEKEKREGGEDRDRKEKGETKERRKRGTN